MITQRRQTITITMSLIRDKRRTNAIKSYRKKEQWANVCKSCGFRFIHCFYVSILIQKLLKGNLQPKLKGASVWSFNARSIVPTGWICHIWSLYWYCKKNNCCWSLLTASSRQVSAPVVTSQCINLRHVDWKKIIDQCQLQWHLGQFLRAPAGRAGF